MFIALGPQATGTVPFLMRQLQNGPPGVRGSAAYVLGGLGATARPAIPALEKALRDPDELVRRSAAVALWRLAGREQPALEMTLRDLRETDPYARSGAADLLGELRAPAGAAVPPLKALLNDPAGQVRESAARALWRITGRKDLALLVLREQLEKEEAGSQALAYLREMGTDAREVLPVLLRKLRKHRKEPRREIFQTMKVIDPEAAAKLGIE